MFEELLLSAEDFSFSKKTSLCLWTNQQSNIRLRGSGNIWKYRIKTEDGTIYSDKVFCSKKSIVDFLLQNYTQYINDENSHFVRYSNTTYSIVLPKEHQHLNVFDNVRIFGKQNEWKIDAYDYFYKYDVNPKTHLEKALTQFLPESKQKEYWGKTYQFKTKPFIIRSLRELIKNNLEDLYDKELYQTMKYNPESIDQRKAWWFPFVCSDINLENIF